MPEAPQLFVGIDLGTTNSAAAVFDGEVCELVRNATGATLTPSVVRIDARERVTVGARARRFLESDPANTVAEFKRLMGTRKAFPFAAAGVSRSPQELAAEILRSLRTDLRDATGVDVTGAVVSVPALFELPQSHATAEAARLAGFERVELIQEPVASALAAGWRLEDDAGAWLVYDLGGGTFDVSLLETRDGLLRVAGHDGDNFLGGRDFDAAILDWTLGELSRRSGAALSRSDPALDTELRRLRVAVEEAKIELSRSGRALLILEEPLRLPDQELAVEVELTRETVERLCGPIVERSLRVCRRLLHDQRRSPDTIRRVVLVGGPTLMPLVRRLIKEGLGAPLAEGHDPMSLVARGAAYFAATAGLAARGATPSGPASVSGAVRLWLQHPTVSSDTTPFVVGRFAAEDAQRAPRSLRIARSDGGWTSEEIAVDRDGSFVATLELRPRAENTFTVEGRGAEGNAVTLDPPSFRVIHGLTIGDPPLSRSIGVALADDTVRVFLERGAPLPASRKFAQQTVSSITGRESDVALRIPIVQGEFSAAHLCRPVGTIEIVGTALGRPLPAGSPVEIFIEIDRGGRLVARAEVPALQKSFEKVERLIAPDADPDALRATLVALRERVAEVRTAAFRLGQIDVVRRLAEAEAAFVEVDNDLEAAHGGDADAAQKARRTIVDLDAEIGEHETAVRWPEFLEDVDRDIVAAASLVARYGSEAEGRLLQEAVTSIRASVQARGIESIRRRLRLIISLGNAAYFRQPRAWEEQLERAAGELTRASDTVEAERVLRAGREAVRKGDIGATRNAVERLWRLLPPDVEASTRPYDSGLR